MTCGGCNSSLRFIPTQKTIHTHPKNKHVSMVNNNTWSQFLVSHQNSISNSTNQIVSNPWSQHIQTHASNH